jgi:hypothetical protein
MNAYLVCLYTAAVRKTSIVPMAVGPNDLLKTDSLDSQFFAASGEKSSLAMEMLTARYSNSYRHDRPIIFDWRQLQRISVVTENMLNESCKLLDDFLARQSLNAIQLLNLHLHGCRAYHDHDYSRCHITEWAIIERLLNHQHKASRCKRLSNSHSPKVWKMVDDLLRLGKLSASEKKNLTALATVRNRWIHELADVAGDSASQALQTTEDLLRQVFQIDVHLPSGCSL